MCLADLGPVLSVDDGRWQRPRWTWRVGRKVVSLAPLVLDGHPVEPGDWLVVHTGLAVELLDETAAADVVAAREEMFVRTTMNREP